MIQELERWRAENSSHRESLRREERYITPVSSVQFCRLPVKKLLVSQSVLYSSTVYYSWSQYNYSVLVSNDCDNSLNSITENELTPLKTQLEEVGLHVEEEVKRWHQILAQPDNTNEDPQYIILIDIAIIIVCLPLTEREYQFTKGHNHQAR